MAKVILKGHIIVPDSDISAVKMELINHIELTRQEIGCFVFKVSQNTENLNRFNVYEEFDWSRDKRTSSGFKATYYIKVGLSTEDFDRIGETVDAGQSTSPPAEQGRTQAQHLGLIDLYGPLVFRWCHRTSRFRYGNHDPRQCGEGLPQVPGARSFAIRLAHFPRHTLPPACSSLLSFQ